jgi:hypothetical protein
VKVYRHQVPADDSWHDITMSGPVVHVACRNGDDSLIHFWTLAGLSSPYTARFRVFGTGNPVPDDAAYRGTGIAEPLVLHLFEASREG